MLLANEMPNDMGKLLIDLENELILLRDEVALVSDKLSVARSGEVNLGEGVLDDRELIADVD